MVRFLGSGCPVILVSIGTRDDYRAFGISHTYDANYVLIIDTDGMIFKLTINEGLKYSSIVIDILIYLFHVCSLYSLYVNSSLPFRLILTHLVFKIL